MASYGEVIICSTATDAVVLQGYAETKIDTVQPSEPLTREFLPRMQGSVMRLDLGLPNIHRIVANDTIG